MAPPVTRAQAKIGESRAEAALDRICYHKDEPPLEDNKSDQLESLKEVLPLSSALRDMDDSATLHGKEAKLLGDMTVDSMAMLRRESRYMASQLAQQIRENNESLLTGLNDSFGAVDERIKTIPTMAPLLFDDATPKVRLSPFSGTTDGIEFSSWLRKFEDVMRTRLNPLTSAQKAYILVAYLEGAAREKIEDLSEEDRQSFEKVAAHLRRYFEGPQQRHIARQTLSSCRQELGESCTVFADRLLKLVRAATAGQDPAIQKDRLLEEFLARLRPQIRYYVKLDNPSSFEHAVNRAQTVELLLAEATAERLLDPTAPSAKADIQALNPPRRVWFSSPAGASPSRRGRPQRRHQRAHRSTFQRRSGYTDQNSGSNAATCYNCGGVGHFARQCPSPRVSHTDRALATDSARGVASTLPEGNKRPSNTLTDARRRINSLSVSLRQKESELDHANIRMQALLERNEMLSRSLYADDESTNSRANKVPVGINSLLLGMAIVLVGVPAGSAQPVWLCPEHPNDPVIRVPLTYNCSRLIPDAPSVPHSMSLQIYRPNTKRYETPASWCKIVEQTVTYSINFFGARFERHSETHRTVSVEHCRLMERHNKCEFGSLSDTGGIFKTSNTLEVAWPSAPFGCCSEHRLSVVNCVRIPTTVYGNHRTDAPSPRWGIHVTACIKRGRASCLTDQ